ncbi:tRNA (adenosine(37)-N6)-threonylcarbamoyltransferase complex dimerization subunit type 1 TsaB [Candidatus Beckwithbacteria bacterium RBG_13_42_9]|uniref:tRNA (Adenosine(37)-N6)-threonylcarbamoyltransferase complex dimerization subunit type 1 TsaB n=1 Tax=Candidatus Beckwithbacteria bacterium RBG_13_42_9 TaxID=1797457 RepID=A0A1F5E7V1_9BACT|nr:MAG: tRNA (adenosine(37)-N6)-threonylcarbamoyltransferase complex dimerization subunit type 1 TsaB [Candidatus Beckwithbacteria bacterium RBG_13_42_9]
MELYIDTSSNQQTIIMIEDHKIVEKYDNPREQRLLEIIEKALKQKKAKIEDISSIKVNLGPGSFTGLRVGCTVANTLGWLLKIPINGKKVGEFVEPKYE